VCPMQKRDVLPGMDASFDFHAEFKECMRDPVIASDGHSYERRNIAELMREQAKQGKGARSPMTSAVLGAGVSSNKTLRFAINEAVDMQLLAMIEADPRVGADIELAEMLAVGPVHHELVDRNTLACRPAWHLCNGKSFAIPCPFIEGKPKIGVGGDVETAETAETAETVVTFV